MVSPQLFTQHKVLFRLSFRPWLHSCSLVLAAKGSDCFPLSPYCAGFLPILWENPFDGRFQISHFFFRSTPGRSPLAGEDEVPGKGWRVKHCFQWENHFWHLRQHNFLFFGQFESLSGSRCCHRIEIGDSTICRSKWFHKSFTFCLKNLFSGTAAAHHWAGFLLWVDWAAN